MYFIHAILCPLSIISAFLKNRKHANNTIDRIDVDDTEALVNKVLTLRDNEELCRQMSLANINKMQTNTIDQIAKNHIQVLESFFKEKKQ